MKLVEILAREWRGWPVQEHLPVSQDAEGGLYVSEMFTESGKTLRLDEEVDLAEDMATAEVTSAQWEAERARIAAMEGVSAFSQEQANAEAERDQRMQYEQELWDKVAVAYVNGAASDPASAWTKRAMNEHVSQAYDIADAFMVERAKRLEGVK